MRRQAPVLLALVGTALLLGLVFAVPALRGGPRPTAPPDVVARTADRLQRIEGPAPTAAAPEGAHNVLLVIACTLRKDQVALYDPSLDTMPFLTGFAARGAHFDDLITAAPWTKAASTAIVTSHHALEVGMVEEGPRRNEQVLPTSVPTLAERFHDAGYRTVGATANPNLHSSYGFHRGFQAYWEPRADWVGKGGVKIHGAGLTARLLEELHAEDGRPFYAQILVIDAHAPFPPAEPIEGLPPSVADYRKALSRLDGVLQGLIEGLEAQGDADDTVIVIVNDHGEGLFFPKHHGKSHGRYLSPSSVGGVGVVVGPGVPAGHRVLGLASQIDLAPTVWSLAGLPPRTDWGGVDLSAAVRGEEPRTGQSRVYSDTWFRKVSRAAFYEDDRACQLAGRDLELTDVNGITFTPGCFDRRADPTHARPRVDRAALRDLNAWRLQALSRGRALAAERSEATGGLDEQLEALGYVD